MDKQKLSFGLPKCGCGCNLSRRKADTAGMKGSIPMGYCPQCGSPHGLVKPEPEVATETESAPAELEE